jgi:hypothetical protein
MAYAYQRANYGDYYQAGGLFGTIGRAIGGVAKVASKVLPGPLGAAAGFVGGALAPTKTRTAAPTTAVARYVPAPTGVMGQPQGTQLPARRTPYLGLPVHPDAGGAPAGYHLNKSDYFLKDGTFIPAGTQWVKNRRLNPGNGRAVRRAARRQEAFVGLAKRAARGTNWKVVAKSYRANWRKPLKK